MIFKYESGGPDKAFLKLDVNINQLNAHVMNVTHDKSATIKFL